MGSAFNLRDRDHGRNAAKDQKAGEEQAEATDERGDFHESRCVISPTRWQKVSMKAGDNDDESLEPHANVDENDNDEHQR